MVISADMLGHETYKPNTETWQQVVDAFGKEVVGANGEIDRKRLGEIVFSDPKARAKLDSITWPQITKLARQRIENLRRQETDTIVLEAAVLIEAGWDSLVDEVWITYSPKDVVLERLKGRSGLSEGQIRDRVNAQLPYEKRIKHGQVIIDNTATLKELRAKVETLWERRKEESSDKNG